MVRLVPHVARCGQDVSSASGFAVREVTSPFRQAQPSSSMAHPAFQTFVMCRILFPPNSMT